MDRDDPDGGGVVGVCRGGAGASRPAAPDDLEHAGGAAGRGLLAAGQRLGPGRRAWPAAGRAEQPWCGPACPAAGRAGGDGPVAPGDGRDRRRGLRVRRIARAPAREPGWGGAARPAGRAAPRQGRGRARARRQSGGRHAPSPRNRVPGAAGAGALGAAAWHVSPGRAAASAPRPRRREPRAERGGAAGVAAPHPRAQPRAEQLARPDQVDRPEPGGSGAARAAADRLARGSPQGPRCDRGPGGVAQPLDGGLRAPGAAAASPPRARPGRRVGAAGRGSWSAPARPRVSRALLVAAAVAVASCRVEPHRVFPPTVDAGPDLRTRPRASAALTFRVTGRPDTAAAWPYAISWGDGATDRGTLTDRPPA